MTEKTVLVTGSTGATGGFTIEALPRRQVPVRAFVGKDDERASRLRALVMQPVFGDLLEIDDVPRAMEGVSAAYFVYRLLPGLVAASACLPQAAAEAGLQGI